MKMKQTALILFLSLTITSELMANRSCYTPVYMPGECIDVQNCKKLLGILNNPQRNRKENMFFRDSACGLHDEKLHVCCEIPKQKGNCTTPDEKEGVCIPLFECSSLLTLTNQYKNLNEAKKDYLRKSSCQDGSAIGVCCSDNEHFENLPKVTLLPPRTDCGREANHHIFENIEDGEVALDQYPWLAQIEYKNENNQLTYSCLGILINSRYVLSTAHCFIYKNFNPVNVILGEYDVTKKVDCRNQNFTIVCNDNLIKMPIAKIIKHAQFNAINYKNDIALIQMTNSIIYSDYVRPICLPQMNIMETAATPSELVIASWGLNYNNLGPHKLKNKLQMKISVVNQTRCREIYKRFSQDILPEYICVADEKGKASCKGDASAPLMMKKNDQWELIAIHLYGTSICDSSIYPDVSLNVYPYIDWIIENLEV